MAQSPCSPELGVSEVSLCGFYVCFSSHSVLVAVGMSVCGTDYLESTILSPAPPALALRLIVRAGHDYSGESVLWGLIPQSGSLFSGTLMPLNPPFRCVICQAALVGAGVI